MKFAVKSLSVLAAAALMGAVAATPASAGGKKCTVEGELGKIFTWDIKRLDRELFGWLKRDHKG